MKKILYVLTSLAALSTQAQTQPGVTINRSKTDEAVTDTLKEGALSDINWSALINRDFVAIGERFHDVHVLDPGWIIQVRFYDRGMMPLINRQRDAGKSFAFTKTNDSRVVAVEGLTDGGIRVVLATADRIGPFVETVSIKSGFYSYTFSIKGLVQDLSDKKAKAKE